MNSKKYVTVDIYRSALKIINNIDVVYFMPSGDS